MTDLEFEYLTFSLPRLRPGSGLRIRLRSRPDAMHSSPNAGLDPRPGVSSCLDPTQTWIPDSDLDPDLALVIDIDLELDP